ncbi:hypothetical protein CPC08DRAFT_365839 [Agrocybe pediades]|nr:hypothetical protein CPC08DRAFT_365839 [Agrocybe pediades]
MDPGLDHQKVAKNLRQSVSKSQKDCTKQTSAVLKKKRVTFSELLTVRPRERTISTLEATSIIALLIKLVAAFL